jgi:hypothetical protein
MSFRRSYPKHFLIIIISWVDDMLIGVEETKNEFFKHFECDDTGEMREYNDNMTTRKDGAIKPTQPVLFAKHVMVAMDSKVRLPMCCIDLICNWSAGGRTRHMETRVYWLRELKEEEPSVVVLIYCPSELNRSDIFTKNVDTATFEEHVRVYCTEEF